MLKFRDNIETIGLPRWHSGEESTPANAGDPRDVWVQFHSRRYPRVEMANHSSVFA